ncbi:GAF and ANTAR domain-containing protein [Nocardia sp. GCM10030253]|uniref:GAF and ANTAR domain-containing protein n=1 Tax=Nocardia sp. GCM10030253 TaxID=3273404 RepID=UPI00362D07C7
MGPAFGDRRHPEPGEPQPHSAKHPENTGNLRVSTLLRSLIRSVGNLAGEFDVIELSQQLLEACLDSTDAADAGLLLADQRGDLRILAASAERQELLDLLQLGAVDGPSAQAYRGMSPAALDDLGGTAHESPEFGRCALAAGYRSAYALPLRLQRDCIGALAIFGASTAALDDADIGVGQVLADLAGIGIAHYIVLAQVGTVYAQLPAVLNNRIAIDQAKGVLAERDSSDMDRAFQRMRGHARATGVRLADLAADIVDGRIDTADVGIEPPD